MQLHQPIYYVVLPSASSHCIILQRCTSCIQRFKLKLFGMRCCQWCHPLLILHIDTSWRAVKPAEVSVHYYSSIDTVYHMLDLHVCTCFVFERYSYFVHLIQPQLVKCKMVALAELQNVPTKYAHKLLLIKQHQNEQTILGQPYVLTMLST